ncbi:unnamed protein product, partial [Ixodes persulcatus]
MCINTNCTWDTKQTYTHLLARQTPPQKRNLSTRTHYTHATIQILSIWTPNSEFSFRRTRSKRTPILPLGFLISQSPSKHRQSRGSIASPNDPKPPLRSGITTNAATAGNATVKDSLFVLSRIRYRRSSLR